MHTQAKHIFIVAVGTILVGAGCSPAAQRTELQEQSVFQSESRIHIGETGASIALPKGIQVADVGENPTDQLFLEKPVLTLRQSGQDASHLGTIMVYVIEQGQLPDFEAQNAAIPSSDVPGYADVGSSIASYPTTAEGAFMVWSVADTGYLSQYIWTSFDDKYIVFRFFNGGPSSGYNMDWNKMIIDSFQAR